MVTSFVAMNTHGHVYLGALLLQRITCKERMQRSTYFSRTVWYVKKYNIPIRNLLKCHLFLCEVSQFTNLRN